MHVDECVYVRGVIQGLELELPVSLSVPFRCCLVSGKSYLRAARELPSDAEANDAVMTEDAKDQESLAKEVAAYDQLQADSDGRPGSGPRPTMVTESEQRVLFFVGLLNVGGLMPAAVHRRVQSIHRLDRSTIIEASKLHEARLIILMRLISQSTPRLNYSAKKQ